MDVVFHAANDDRLAIEGSGDATQVVMKFVTKWEVVQVGSAVFGGEDDVDENFGEGLGYGWGVIVANRTY